MTSAEPRRAGFIAVALGAVFLLIGAVQGVTVASFRSRAARATGAVVALNAGPAHPQVRFSTPSGEQVEFPQGGFVLHAVGDTVDVLYEPGDPHDAVVDSFGAQLGFPALHVVTGALALAAGLRSLRRR